MKKSKLMIAIALGASLAFGVAAQAKEKEHEEESIDSSKVPAAVLKAADKEANGGKVVRWEKEGNKYEAVIDKNGKEWSIEVDQNGKFLKEYEESKEKE